MKVEINKDLCIGCGNCIGVCPSIFELNEENKSQIKKDADYHKDVHSSEYQFVFRN